ncbi:uncharacterized protein LOC109844304 isoform X2 [Asparagus officinalis]|nr:uncharacterized protein LOC109844304 isoform X2 [Asparagus officinalis]XP_020268883.1 uncharacterized protein LOC109844304 isoform X2 [Asparagus officinalis]
MVNGDRQKIKCRYCSKVILGGGISRLKQHLAGERGNIAPCEKVPDDVKSQIQQHMGFKVLEKLKRQKESESLKNFGQHFNEEDYDGEFHNETSTRGIFCKRRGREVENVKSHKRTEKFFASQVSQAAQSALHSTFASQESIDQADIAVAKFLYDAGIPLNAANSYYFQKMADAIAAVGPGYKMPSYHSLRAKLLNKCGHEVGQVCKEIRKSWEATGCTVMVDRWVDRNSQVVLNFLVYCPKGTMLIRSVDASDIDLYGEGLLSLFDSIIQEVGLGNVVNFITDTTPSHKVAGNALMNKYKTFIWSTCANHGIELILKELCNLNEVKEVLAQAKRICQFIYNNAWVLNLMRKKTEGRDIFQPAMTEFVTKFLTLDNMISVKDSLHQMFTSTLWEQSTFSKQSAGEDVTEIVLNPQFWSSCMRVVKVSKPLVTVLHQIDSEDRPSVGYFYNAMEKAKKSIMLAFNNNETDYLPYLEIIQNARSEFHSPLHAAACYLNPSIYYGPSFSINSVIHKGLLDCVEILEPNLKAQDNITRHKACYEEAVGDFSRPVAIRGRETLSPATWWSLYASDYPDLQHFAVRILSQTCTITTAERNWTMKECMHSRNRNRLEQERLTDLTFVHYNLRLQQRQLAASGSKTPIRGERGPVSLDGRDFSIGEWIEDPGVLEGQDTSWMNVALPSDVDNDSIGVDDGGTEMSD